MSLLTGQEFDDETGLYYYVARYYDPVLGRFQSPDPIVQAPFNPQNLNRYSYVLNNPVNFVDPTGNFADDLTFHIHISRDIALAQQILSTMDAAAASPGLDFGGSIGAVTGGGGFFGSSFGALLGSVLGQSSSTLGSTGGAGSNGGLNPNTRNVVAGASIGQSVSGAAVPDWFMPGVHDAGAIANPLGPGDFFAVGAIAGTGFCVLGNLGSRLLGRFVARGGRNLPAVYDPDFAARQILGRPTNVTPGGRTITDHAARQMMNPPKGRVRMSVDEVDNVLDTATRIRKLTPHPKGITVTVQRPDLPGRPQVVIDAATGKRVVTTIRNR